MVLVGKQNLSFPDSKTGELINGVKLHFNCSDNKVDGMAAMTQFIRDSHPCYQKAINLQFGDFDIIYGRNNSIQNLLQ